MDANQKENPIKITVIIPVFNGSQTIKKCLDAVYSSRHASFECIIVDDGSTDDSLQIASEFQVRITSTQNGPRGPAHARNVGAKEANGEILLFIDSDVMISPETLQRVQTVFDHDREIAAIFGSYDDQPEQRDFFSQYKNLYHHFVHQNAQKEASTFWSGCGAIRRDIFLQTGGFDADQYPQPSIEDIELGYRLRGLGYKISLEKDIQVKHLKRWSFIGLIKTDISQRAVPWSQLILNRKRLPNDLNVSLSQRISTILLVSLIFIAFLVGQTNLILIPLLVFFSILCTSCWQWNQADPVFEINQRKEPVIFGLVAVIFIVTLWIDQLIFLAPFVILVPLLIMGNWLSKSSPMLRRLLYLGMLTTLLIPYYILLMGYPIYIGIPILLILLIIVFLNRKLYLFFVQKRGLLFTLAALPMQFLYYLYSLFSFTLVSFVHYSKILFHRTKSQVEKSTLPGSGQPM